MIIPHPPNTQGTTTNTHQTTINSIHNTTHKIITNNYPCKAKTRPLTLDKLNAARKIFDELEKTAQFVLQTLHGHQH